jgi:hypothetical protein
MSKVGLLFRASILTAACAVFLTIGFGMAAPQASSKAGAKDVYVCACMKTASCPCAATSNKAGKCPCGDEMKAVPRHGKWAATNRRELYR